MYAIVPWLPRLFYGFLIDTSYAVNTQTEGLTRGKPDSPAAAWCFFIFVSKKLALRANFLETKMGSSALPEMRTRCCAFLLMSGLKSQSSSNCA